MNIPSYIEKCIGEYGNTIIAKKTLKKIGGKEAFIDELKKRGFKNIKLIESSSFEEFETKMVNEHFIIEADKKGERK